MPDTLAPAAGPASSRRNNFDLVRLVAALQVVVSHGLEHLRLGAAVPAWAGRVLSWFPGVPIFFVVSGYLIAQSYERSPGLRIYARHRAARIFPALWPCLGLSILTMATVQPAALADGTAARWAAWLAAQLTVFQFYNPRWLRDYGVGAPNGSLWTIPVELGFYVMLPALLLAIGRRRPTRRGAADLVLVAVAAASFALWLRTPPTPATRLQFLTFVSPFPYFWMFLTGTLCYRHRERLLPLLRGAFPWWLGAYLATAALLPGRGPQTALTYVVLAGTVLAAAFTAPALSERVLRGNDCSYGVYLYHMVVVNALVALGLVGRPWLLAGVVATTLALAWLSWRLVEQPVLRLARRQTRRADPSPSDPALVPAPSDRAW